MKWIGNRQSDNVEDRRGMSGGGKAIAGGGAIAIVFFLIKAFFPQAAPFVDTIQQQQQQQTTQSSGEPVELTAEQKEAGDFAKTIFAYTEDTWGQIFKENGAQYEEPKLVLFSDAVETACGNATSASGPFYCPGDHKVYFDLEFMKELKTRFGAEGGDFATAYVIAHEVGHHIQTLLGTSTKMRQLQEGKTEAEANKLSVCLELQADFYAGVWAKYNKDYLEAGDIEEAISAANAVGDDAIQSKMQGHVNQETFTHGSSEQRIYWFKKGFQTGDIKQGDTFAQAGFSL
ncbi:neutral zinc metallopeptidase [Flavobacterium sp. SUN052]|uniref:KPN_02809 family neutral zinc metallopeptidase n=1 Tax=Flavobacterium sp. SUN052 TaxID=3002441 RepID=UPI00237D7315|nr:neutral zinc metallopeptidase [Flavobacterium sp. SUN052]MEC4005826.1 neutral zinc metallopeptidase [Flavobacterium sp. SUN052]